MKKGVTIFEFDVLKQKVMWDSKLSKLNYSNKII